MLAAEHVDRKALALAVGRQPQAPPGAGGIDDADAFSATSAGSMMLLLAEPVLPLPVLPTKAMWCSSADHGIGFFMVAADNESGKRTQRSLARLSESQAGIGEVWLAVGPAVRIAVNDSKALEEVQILSLRPFLPS
jgi:hypothetical protein